MAPPPLSGRPAPFIKSSRPPPAVTSRERGRSQRSDWLFLLPPRLGAGPRCRLRLFGGRGHRMTSGDPKVPPNGPKLTPKCPQIDPKVTPKGPQVTPNDPKLTPKGPQTAPNGPKVSPNGPKMTPNGPKLPLLLLPQLLLHHLIHLLLLCHTPKSPQIGTNRPKMTPNRDKTPQNDPKWT